MAWRLDYTAISVFLRKMHAEIAAITLLAKTCNYVPIRLGNHLSKAGKRYHALRHPALEYITYHESY